MRLINFALVPVPPLGLEIDDRVVARDRLLDGEIRSLWVRGGQDPKPRSVSEIRLRRLTVMFDSTDPAAISNNAL